MTAASAQAAIRNSASSGWSAFPSHRSRSSASATTSSAPSRRTLRLLDPALTTATSLIKPGSWRRGIRRLTPFPVSDLGQVFAVLANPDVVACERIGHPLPELAGPLRQARDTVDDVHDEVEPVHVVEDEHVERCGGGAFFFVTAHVERVV